MERSDDVKHVGALPSTEEPLLRRTLVVAGAMLGACVLFLGGITLILGLVLKPASSSAEPRLTDSDRNAPVAPATTAPRLPGKSI
jgi:hypothetical protein